MTRALQYLFLPSYSRFEALFALPIIFQLGAHSEWLAAAIFIPATLWIAWYFERVAKRRTA